MLTVVREARSKRPPGSSHRGSVAARMRRRVTEGGERYWRHDDFPGLSPAAVAMALSRLARTGELQRVRKGLYYRPRQTRFGQSVPAVSDAVAHSLRAPVHPTGLTAANALGFTAQNPARLEYATPASGPPAALAGATVRTRRPAARSGLSTEEGALLEFLRDRGQTSDLPPAETSARLRRLASAPERFARLARAAEHEPARVRAMLGALGQELGVKPALLKRLRNGLSPLSRYDFGSLRSLRHAEEWQAR
jgi:hypothetical protein